MLELQYKSPEIETASRDGASLLLIADVTKPHQLFQGQSLKVKTGVAIKSDQHVFAVPLQENNRVGLIMGSGVELLETEGDEIEVTIWNRNHQGQQRMIEIMPDMPLAQLVIMPKYCHDSAHIGDAEKKPPAASKTGTGKPGRPAKPKPAAAEAKPKTGTDD